MIAEVRDLSFLESKEWGNMLSSYDKNAPPCPRPLPPSKEEKREESKQEKAWPIALDILHRSADAMTYQANKMDIQISLLNTLAVYVAKIDDKISNLNNLIRRAQSGVDLPQQGSGCSPIIEKLSTLPVVMDKLLTDLKTFIKTKIIPFRYQRQ